MCASTYHGQGVEDELDCGIVCGHAYSVLAAYELNTSWGVVKLIKLRNPWGGTEWNWDWSDNSSLWTPELKQQVGFRKANDGIFHMTIQDYLWYF